MFVSIYQNSRTVQEKFYPSFPIVPGHRARSIRFLPIRKSELPKGFLPHVLSPHTVRYTRKNHIARTSFDISLMDAGRLDEALSHFMETLRVKPTFPGARKNLEEALSRKKDTEFAVPGGPLPFPPP